MNITLIIDSLTSGGAQRQMVYLANGLSRSGHSVALIVYHDSMQLLNELDCENVRLVKVLKGRTGIELGFVVRLVATLKALQPDVIVSFLTGPNLWARLCGPLAGTRSIITSLRNTDLDRSRVDALLERLFRGRSSTIVANTEAAKGQLVKYAKVPAAKIAVIRNGVDANAFYRLPDEHRLKTRMQYRLKQQDFVVILPGRIEEQKNHLCLIKAVAALGDLRNRIHVLFFGNDMDSVLKARLMSQVKDFSLGNRIQFCGTSSRMVEVYNMADVVILPSKWEGLPNVVLEAMACEIPVIVSDVADNRTLVNADCGFLFQSDDSQQLAAQIALLAASSEASRRAMGAAGRKRIQADFSIDSCLQRFLSLIEDLPG